MTWGWPYSTRRLSSQWSSNNTNTDCTSWYGHRFEKFDETTIFCPTCGQTRKVKP